VPYSSPGAEMWVQRAMLLGLLSVRSKRVWESMGRGRGVGMRGVVDFWISYKCRDTGNRRMVGLRVGGVLLPRNFIIGCLCWRRRRVACILEGLKLGEVLAEV